MINTRLLRAFVSLSRANGLSSSIVTIRSTKIRNVITWGEKEKKIGGNKDEKPKLEKLEGRGDNKSR